MSARAHVETLPVTTENLEELWVDLAFLFSPVFIYGFLFLGLRPFQVVLVLYPFLVVMYIES